MKTIGNKRPEEIWRKDVPASKFWHGIMVCALAFSFVSCQSIDPRAVDVELPETLPSAKITSYTEALSQLGLMTEVYSTDVLRIQSNPIGDLTGASRSTGSEIPRDITEIIKTSLNSIGGNVVFIPYDPAFIQNQQVTGYSNFENKVIPDLVLSGGITEFDRGLTTKGENTDLSLEAEIQETIPDFLPSKNIGLRYGNEAKAGLARITLDFNLLDFETLTGVPKINAVNTMEVLKVVAGKELGISLFGQNFGLKGTIKKVQGRHAAVRLLVELSMIQIVGKYLAIPYWRVLGEDALPDRVVTDAVARFYSSLTESEVTTFVQQWLFIYGHELALNGELDEKTRKALAAVDTEFDPSSDSKISSGNFVQVYLNLPISYKAEKKRQELVGLLQEQEPGEEAAAASTEAVPATETAPALAEKAPPTPSQQDTGEAAASASVEATPATGVASPQVEEGQPTLAQQKPVQNVPEVAVTTTEKSPPKQEGVAQKVAQKKAYPPGPKRSGIGRFLTEEDW